MKTLIVALSLFVWLPSTYSMIPAISREHKSNYFSEGVFQGGSKVSAALTNIRVGRHPSRKFERWVLDFSDPKGGEVGKIAPRFVVRYQPSADSVPGMDKNRLVVALEKVQSSTVKPQALNLLTQRSPHVKKILIHPPLENGDRSVEFILKKTIAFEAHQPLQKPGRLVLDLIPHKKTTPPSPPL